MRLCRFSQSCQVMLKTMSSSGKSGLGEFGTNVFQPCRGHAQGCPRAHDADFIPHQIHQASAQLVNVAAFLTGERCARAGDFGIDRRFVGIAQGSSD